MRKLFYRILEGSDSLFITFIAVLIITTVIVNGFVMPKLNHILREYFFVEEVEERPSNKFDLYEEAQQTPHSHWGVWREVKKQHAQD